MGVECDAAPHVPSVSFPTATPRVMRVERTFWEKATAIHVFCKGGKLRGSRFSRHWYDLAQLDRAGHVTDALKSREIANQVARHKGVFFAEKDPKGTAIDYAKAVSGGLSLTPKRAVREIHHPSSSLPAFCLREPRSLFRIRLRHGSGRPRQCA